MPTYDSLTQEEKNLLAAFTNNVRAWCGEQARANNHARAINDQYNALTSSIISSLNNGEVVPNASGLQGAASLVKADLVSIVAHIQNVLSDMSTHTTGFDTAAIRQLWTKAAGAKNMIG